VLDYVDTHLEEPLDLGRLSAVAAFSKFHFHRQFAAAFGIGVFRYVQLARMKRASWRLAFRDDASVLEIAQASGYEGPEAFARAYRKSFGQSPSAFREDPQWHSWYASLETTDSLRSIRMKTPSPADVEIVDFAGMKVATLEHRGDPRRLGDSIRRFIAWRKESGLHPSTSATFNILYDDPAAVAPDDYRFDLCAQTPRDVPANGHGVVTKHLPAGRCARLRIQGGDDALASGVTFLYSQWLPNSGEELRDFPLFLQRVSFFPDVPECEQIVEVYLPLR
jgi:AraC family transcriptional regulator